MRHASDIQERTQRVVQLLRPRWDRLDEDERDWLGQYWPDAGPDGPATAEVRGPDPAVLHGWILGEPLFAPVHSG